MELARARALVEAALANGGSKSLKGLAPVALRVSLTPGTDPLGSEVLLERRVVIEPAVHPLLDAQMALADASKRGGFSWGVGLGRDPNLEPLEVILDRVAPGTIVEEQLLTNADGETIPLQAIAPHQKANSVDNAFRGSPAAWALTPQRLDNLRTAAPDYGAASMGLVALRRNERQLMIRVRTNGLHLPEELDLPHVKLDLRPAGSDAAGIPTPVHAADALRVIDWAQQFRFVCFSDDDQLLDVLRRRVRKTVTAHAVKGRPGLARVFVGRDVKNGVAREIDTVDPVYQQAACPPKDVPARAVAALMDRLPKGQLVAHRDVEDVARMSVAPDVDDPQLRPHQRTAVGLHAAAGRGFLNACSPGLGKTIMSLRGMREHAQRTSGWRGLVVVESNVRDQWSQEATRWFPEARIVTVDAGNKAAQLDAALADAGADPVLVITSYALAMRAADAVDEIRAEEAEAERRRKELALLPPPAAAGPASRRKRRMSLVSVGQLALDFGLDLLSAVGAAPEPVLPDAEEAGEPRVRGIGRILLGVGWDDLIADEAVTLLNPGTKQYQALWELRKRAKRAVALTGTPVNRSADDLGRLLAWTLNDVDLFRGHRLAAEFDLSVEEDQRRFADAIGPLMFRRDKSEIADEIPPVVPKVVLLEPSADERILSQAALTELRRAFEDLVAQIELKAAMDPDDGAAEQVRAALVAARGAWMGGSLLARMAASDPAALIDSQSAGAILLREQGLVAAATRRVGTKRAAVVKMCVKRVKTGKKIVIFTEFRTVADGLIDSLEAEGIRVGAVLGGGGKRRDRMVNEFRDGDLDVLVCTSAGERGLNLQTADTLIHYDLAWTPKSLLQRTGRVERIGATAEEIEIIYPVMVDTVEERVVGLVVARAGTALQVLDAPRGVDVTKTELGRALGSLPTAISGTGLNKKDQAMLEFTKELLLAA